ncbi:oligosaccharide flippase family protein [Natranaerofaba carboxydovora]|uniref:oligosaccharide flippase family protein n=1 Tax=Natranaerofaba carboxydovora TaxID=2742683 RepID=UPI001F131C55|nr:oligosaccharide flippase family protein [Natranaerofaba carboxydovora]UMZ74723.1 Teichuronic acid biosynthesis protein TuaB [Natranaerofaba carboxydovora]
MEKSKKKFITGVKWTTLETGISAGIESLNHILKAIFLSPYEFAYIAIINIVINTSQRFEDFGFSKAIIQKDEVNNEEITSVFLLNIVAGLLLFGILNLIAPFVSGFLELPGLAGYLHLASILLILKAPTLVFRSTLEREMKFKQLVKVRLFNQIGSFILLGVLLYLGYGVISVIYANILRAFVNSTTFMIYNYKLTGYKLIKSASIESLRHYYDFGKFVFGKTAINSVTKHLDEILIGYFLAPEILGFYYFSKNMVEKLKKLIKRSFGKVLYSYFSKLEKKDELFQIYEKITQLLAFFSFPVFIGVALTANLFVPLIFGEDWQGGVIFIQVFSVVSALTILSTGTASNLIYSLGKSKLNFQIDSFSNVLYIAALFIFAQYGVAFVITIRAIKGIVTANIKQLYAMKSIERSIKDILLIAKWPFLAVATMAVVVVGLQLMLINLMYNEIAMLLVVVGAGASTYILICWNMTKKIYWDLRKVL